MLGEHGIEVKMDTINVYIIASLAGGTGSGMFLDTAFLVKHLQQNIRTVGFLVLPRIFGDVPRCEANAYAGLMELEYYSYKNLFEVEWKPEGALKLPPPPFDYTYLIDGMNETGRQIGEKDKARIFELLADNIFIDFSKSDFAAYKRGVRINLTQYLYDMFGFIHYTSEGKGVMTESFPCRYSSFGTSSITYPLERIKNACAYKLALDVARYWGTLTTSKPPKESELRDKVIKEFLPAIGALEGSSAITGEPILRNDILDSLYKSGEHGATFKTKINNWTGGLKQKIMGNLPKVEGIGWKTFLRNEIEQEMLLFKEDTNPEKCGENIRKMDENKVEFLANIKSNIDSEIAKMVTNQYEGVGYAIEILKELKALFTAKEHRYIPKFKNEQKILEDTLKTLKTRYEDILEEIGEVETGFGKILPHRKIALTFELDKLTETIYDYFWAVIQFRARKLAIGACNELLNYIGLPEAQEEEAGAKGKIKELMDLYGKISKLEEEFQKKFEFYREPVRNILKVTIYDENDIENLYYPKYMDKGEELSKKINAYSQSILQALKIGIMDLPEWINSCGGLEKAEKMIVNLTRKPFEKIGEDFNILDMFFRQKNFTEQLGKSQIKDGLETAQPWLKKDKELGQFTLSLHKQKYFIGGNELKSGSVNSYAQRFMEGVESQQAPNYPAVSFYETLDKNEILFYTEVAGFPICYSNTIRKLRASYKDLIRKDTALHTDYVSYKFKDLLMLSTEERRELQESQRVFLLGIILGIIELQMDERTKKVMYKYDMPITFTSTEPQFLGYEDVAVSTLFERNEVRTSILKKINERINELQDKEKIAYLDALFSWYINKVYLPEEIELPGGVRETKFSPERIILVEMVNTIEERIPENERQNFETKVKGLITTVEDFSKKLYDKRVLDIAKLREG